MYNRNDLTFKLFLFIFRSDGFSPEYGVTFNTTIIDKFDVSFGHEGETMSLGCTVIVYPTVKRYQPEVVWYRNGKYECVAKCFFKKPFKDLLKHESTSHSGCPPLCSLYAVAIN